MAHQAPQKEDWTFFFNFDAGETPQSQESNNNIIATPGELSHEEIELRSAESSDRYPASPGHPSFEGSLQELEAFGDIVGLDVDPEALDNMVGNERSLLRERDKRTDPFRHKSIQGQAFVEHGQHVCRRLRLPLGSVLLPDSYTLTIWRMGWHACLEPRLLVPIYHYCIAY